MTEDQKQQIRYMRHQGIGYKKIAETLGLSRDGVRRKLKIGNFVVMIAILGIGFSEKKMLLKFLIKS